MDPQPANDRFPADADGTPATPTDAELDDGVQAAVRQLLRATPDPGPMPAELSRRIEGSLAQAAVLRSGDHALFDELGFGEPGAVQAAPTHDTIVFSPGGDGPHDPGGDNVVPLQRRRWPLVGVAAAVVALLAIAGALIVQQRGTNAGLAAIPAQGTAAGSAGSVHVQVSTTAYTKADLVTAAQALIASPGPDASTGDAPSAGPLVTQAGAAACVQALGAGDAGSVSIDLATYDGQPAAIVVVRRSDSTSVYAVQRDCGDGDAGVIQDAVEVP